MTAYSINDAPASFRFYTNCFFAALFMTLTPVLNQQNCWKDTPILGVPHLSQTVDQKAKKTVYSEFRPVSRI